MATAQEKKAFIERKLADWNADNFCKGMMAQNVDGKGVLYDGPSAVKFCVMGKLYKETEADKFIYVSALVDEIDEDYLNAFNRYMSSTNDTMGQEAVKNQLLKLYT